MVEITDFVAAHLYFSPPPPLNAMVMWWSTESETPPMSAETLVCRTLTGTKSNIEGQLLN